ncbi:urease accessory protein UreF [Rhizocola hellebori]|uniref:Urease accessory protein UreF n=1 Tax=Rhizocola hellebori TaxID=1392758 RepID=A0A8J3QEV4_9ACTN|nr:urease accessory UreF family protein [Rhizocola hellebori]GIH09584.1 urease accessory protein UreF [Rhizocola hellebori]
MTSALLLLADGRFPAGGHAHSSGLEAAVAAGRVSSLSTLESFLLGRLYTTGLVTAAFAAASHHAAAHPATSTAAAHPAAQGAAAAHLATPSGAVEGGSVPRLGDMECAAGSEVLLQLDEELEARMASPATRVASRKQGAALLRAAKMVWPGDGYGLLPQRRDGVHHAVVLGVTAAAAGLSCAEAALIACYSQVTGQASAALRLLGFSPYDIQRLLAQLAGQCDAVAMAATAHAGKDPAELPMFSSPLADISAELHATWEVRLFAS